MNDPVPAAAPDADSVQAWLLRRRRAGKRIAAWLTVALTGQIASWALTPPGLRALTAALMVGFGLVSFLGIGLLVPRPPGGFRWRWRSHAAPESPRPDPGFDLLAVVSGVGAVLPWMVTNAWLQAQDLPLLPYLATAVFFVLVGNALSLGTIEVRRRLDRRPTRSRLVDLEETTVARTPPPASSSAPPRPPSRSEQTRQGQGQGDD